MDVPDDGSTAIGSVMVVQSSSLGSGTVELGGISKFRNLTIPVMFWEASNLDGMGFQPANGSTTTGTQINIVDASHPLAAGFPAGPVTVATSAQTFSQGTPVNAHIVGQNATDPTLAVLFYYNKGDTGDAGFVMPARRSFFFFQDNTAAAATADGWKLFDASVDWNLGKGVATPPTISYTRNGAQLTMTWTGGGALQSTPNLASPVTWTPVGASPQTVTTSSGTRYYRVQQ